ncbi:Crp/Fnr family transcriptional regulator [Puteibacter caeruleilacunae]|nr:Crp/Fnr family transcriptional regulator [Puteibacter caeruleilacunae]
MFEILQESPVFKGLGSERIESLLREVGYQIKKYGKEDMISMREEQCNTLQIVIKGSVKGEMLDLSGKVIKIEDIPAPRPLASAFLFGKNNRFPVDIIANEDVSILRLSKESVLQLFMKDEDILKNYLNAISNRTQFLTRKLFFLSFKTIREKIAFFLNEQLKNQGGNEIVLKLTQREMAELFGVARPSLARGFAELEKTGVIELSRKNVKVLDQKGLLELIKS